jgi:hypothetical protein
MPNAETMAALGLLIVTLLSFTSALSSVAQAGQTVRPLILLSDCLVWPFYYLPAPPASATADLSTPRCPIKPRKPSDPCE